MSIDDLEKILVEDVEWQKSIICQLNNHRISEPPQNSTKKKRGTTGYAQQLIIKELKFLRMSG